MVAHYYYKRYRIMVKIDLLKGQEASSSLSFYDDETFTEIEGEYVYNGVIASSPWVNLQGVMI